MENSKPEKSPELEHKSLLLYWTIGQLDIYIYLHIYYDTRLAQCLISLQYGRSRIRIRKCLSMLFNACDTYIRMHNAHTYKLFEYSIRKQGVDAKVDLLKSRKDIG